MDKVRHDKFTPDDEKYVIENFRDEYGYTKSLYEHFGGRYKMSHIYQAVRRLKREHKLTLLTTDEKLTAQQERWLERQRAKGFASHKAWLAAHPDYYKEYYSKHKTDYTERQRRLYRENEAYRERRKQYSRDYYKRTPEYAEKRREYGRAYRARVKAAKLQQIPA